MTELVTPDGVEIVLPSVRALSLRGNKLTRFSGIERIFPNLERLDIRENCLSDVGEIERLRSMLESLREVWISGNLMRSKSMAKAGDHSSNISSFVASPSSPSTMESPTATGVDVDGSPTLNSSDYPATPESPQDASPPSPQCTTSAITTTAIASSASTPTPISPTDVSHSEAPTQPLSATPAAQKWSPGSAIDTAMKLVNHVCLLFV